RRRQASFHRREDEGGGVNDLGGNASDIEKNSRCKSYTPVSPCRRGSFHRREDEGGYRSCSENFSVDVLGMSTHPIVLSPESRSSPAPKVTNKHSPARLSDVDHGYSVATG